MKPSRRRFDENEYLTRQTRTRLAMEQQGIDLLVVVDPSNIYWLTGYDAWSFYVYQCVVISQQGDLFWFGRGIDAPAALITTDLREHDIVSYPDDYVQSATVHPSEYLADTLKARRLDAGVIALELDNYYQTSRGADAFRARLPDSRIVDGTALVNWQRAIKSPTEIEYMRRAGQVVESVYAHIGERVTPGMRKNELVAEILWAATRGTPEHYGDYAAILPLIGNGEEACACHLTWDGERIEADSGLCLELAGAHNRYHCPCSRTFYFGTPPPEYRRLEAVIQEVIERVLEQFRPGNSCREVATTFYDFLHEQGYEKEHRCGYSIGLSYPPDWGERTMSIREIDDTVLQEGMCFHFMPGIWFDDWGFEMTESLVVTASGGECLSQVSRQLLVR